MSHFTKSLRIGLDEYQCCKRCGRAIFSPSSAEYGFCSACLQDIDREGTLPEDWTREIDNDRFSDYAGDHMRDMAGTVGPHLEDRALIIRDDVGNEVTGPKVDILSMLKGKD